MNHRYIREQQDELWQELEKTYNAKRQMSKERRGLRATKAKGRRRCQMIPRKLREISVWKG